MKKKCISIIAVIIVVIAVFISIRFFRGGSPLSFGISDNGKQMSLAQENEDTPAQAGKPDEASMDFAKVLKKTTGEEIDVKNIVSTGKQIREGKFAYIVDSCKVEKNYPGYQLPEGRPPLSEHPGAQLDTAGNITNDFSYVVVNISVENLKDEEIVDYIWGSFKLGITGVGSDQYVGSVTYLGEVAPREYRKDYNKETFQPKEKKDMALIFVVEDELIEGQQLYLKINSSGAATVNPDYDVRRYIVLK